MRRVQLCSCAAGRSRWLHPYQENNVETRQSKSYHGPFQADRRDDCGALGGIEIQTSPDGIIIGHSERDASRVAFTATSYTQKWTAGIDSSCLDRLGDIHLDLRVELPMFWIQILTPPKHRFKAASAHCCCDFTQPTPQPSAKKHLVRVRSTFRVDKPLTKSSKTCFLALPCLVDQEGKPSKYRPLL